MMDEPDLLSTTDSRRLTTSKDLCPNTQGLLGQYMTPSPVATLMASMPSLPQQAYPPSGSRRGNRFPYGRRD